MLPSRWCQLFCLLVTVTLTACHQQHYGHEPPEWLMGLEQLLQEGGQPAVTASLQAAQHHHSTSTQTPPHGQLLRPKTLPPVASAQLTAVQDTTSHSVTLASVSRAYGITKAQLTHMMEQDRGLRASTQGLLVWACSNSHKHDASDAEAAPQLMTTTDASNPPADLATTADDNSATDRTAAGKATANAATASAVAVASVADSAAGMAWLANGLFTAVIPPSPAQVDAVGQLSVDLAKAWISAPAPAPSTSVTLQSISASHASSHEGRPQAQIVASQPTTPGVVQQPGPQPLPQQAFQLHNRQPGSVQHTIFLDFRGCTITNSYWNTATNKPVLTTQPFDLDGDPSTFSVKEQAAIVSIWQAVAQDFAAWAVDVTTEDPGQDALVRSYADDTEFGMHVCVGGSSATTVGGLSGGLAFTGAWGQLGSGLQPVLVFPEQLGKGHCRAVADSISHEVGHTIGLAHFGGSSSAPYNDGSGPWGPLLGLPYGRVLSQWSVGTAVTGSLQDDLQLIAQQLPPLADDHGDSAGTATPLCEVTQVQGATRSAPAMGAVQGTGMPAVTCRWLKARAQEGSDKGGYMVKATVRGVISNSSDSDCFRVHVSRPGALHVKLTLPSSAAGYGVNNLLAAVVVTAVDGTQLTSVKPESGSETALQATAHIAAAGIQYVSIVPAGVPGVSSYGSLGDYVLSVTLPAQLAAQQAHGTVAVQVPAAQPLFATTSTHQDAGCDQCAPHGGCAAHSGRDSAGTQHCSSCLASKGFVMKATNSVASAAAPGALDAAYAGTSSSSSCQFQEVKPLSFSTRTCSTAEAGATVLLNFTVSNPPACWEGSIIAAAPEAQLLQSCPCRQSPKRTQPHKLPTPQLGTLVQADGSFTCRHGVYAYGWQVPSKSGCYRLSIAMADGSTVLTVLRIVDVDANVVTQAT